MKRWTVQSQRFQTPMSWPSRRQKSQVEGEGPQGDFHRLCILMGMVRPSVPLAGISKEITWSPTQGMGDLTIYYPNWTLRVKEMVFIITLD